MNATLPWLLNANTLLNDTALKPFHTFQGTCYTFKLVNLEDAIRIIAVWPKGNPIIFSDNGTGNLLLARSKENTLHLEDIDDPDYYGFITFESPGSVFSYTADGQMKLTSEEVTELIEHLSNVRDNPPLWNQPD